MTPEPPTPTGYWTVDQAAARWGVTPRRVRRLIQLGRVPEAVKLGRDWLIPAETDKPAALKRGPKPKTRLPFE